MRTRLLACPTLGEMSDGRRSGASASLPNVNRPDALVLPGDRKEKREIAERNLPHHVCRNGGFAARAGSGDSVMALLADLRVFGAFEIMLGELDGAAGRRRSVAPHAFGGDDDASREGAARFTLGGF